MSLMLWPVRVEKHPHPHSAKCRLKARAAEAGMVSRDCNDSVGRPTVTHTIVLSRLSCCE